MHIVHSRSVGTSISYQEFFLGTHMYFLLLLTDYRILYEVIL